MEIKSSLLTNRLYLEEINQLTEYFVAQLQQFKDGSDTDEVDANEVLKRVVFAFEKEPNHILSKKEENFLLSKLFDSTVCTSSSSSLQLLLIEKSKPEYLRSILCRCFKLTIFRTLTSSLTKNDISSAVAAALHTEAIKLLKTSSSSSSSSSSSINADAPNLIPVSACIKALSSLPLLSLHRNEIISLFYSVQDVVEENCINRKSFAIQVSRKLFEMNTAEYLEVRAFILENAGLQPYLVNTVLKSLLLILF